MTLSPSLDAKKFTHIPVSSPSFVVNMPPWYGGRSSCVIEVYGANVPTSLRLSPNTTIDSKLGMHLLDCHTVSGGHAGCVDDEGGGRGGESESRDEEVEVGGRG